VRFVRQSIRLCVLQIFPALLSGQSAAASGHVSDSSVAHQLFEMANQSRVESGVKPLDWDRSLADAALKHCIRMSSEIAMSHRYDGESDLATRVATAGAHFSTVEENIASGPSAGAIHQGWLNSPGHRANLLNPSVDRVGIAVIAYQGLFFAVADYAHTVPVLKPTEVEGIFAALLRSKHILVSSETADARRHCASSGNYHGSYPARLAVRWQNSDVTQLPTELAEVLANGSYRKASVGSCAAQNVNGDFTTYRVAVLLY
jgi:hypothetical protein